MDIQVARQPIFNKRKQVFGYELLYRANKTAQAFDGFCGDEATSRVIIDSFLGIGITKMTGGRKAFVNFTRNLLEGEVATLFPAHTLVVEVLENVAPTQKIFEKCQYLKSKGYSIVLDDFIFVPEFEQLLSVADIVKIDFLTTPLDEIKDMVKRLRRANLRFLAEKVESKEMFDQAQAMGFSFFQGYFFSKPDIVSGLDIRPLNVNYLRLLRLVNEDEYDYSEAARIIMQDVSLSYKLLRMVNSAAFAFRKRISSVQHALAILGTDDTRKWVSLVSLVGLGTEQPTELLRLSLMRAKMAEALAFPLGMAKESNQMFMMGLFSLMEVILGRDFNHIFSEIHASHNVRNALLFQMGPFAPVLQLIIAYEQGEWDTMKGHMNQLKLNNVDLADIYMEALRWCDAIFTTP